MSPSDDSAAGATQGELFPASECELAVTLDLSTGNLRFEWARQGHPAGLISGVLKPCVGVGLFFRFHAFEFKFNPEGLGASDRCGCDPSSTHALMRRLRAAAPPVAAVRVGVLSDSDLGPAKPGTWDPVVVLPPDEGWKWIGRFVARHASVLESAKEAARATSLSVEDARQALRMLAAALLGVVPAQAAGGGPRAKGRPAAPKLWGLRIDFDEIECCASFTWSDPEDGSRVADARVRPCGFRQLSWELASPEQEGPAEKTPADAAGVKSKLGPWFKRFPTDVARVAVLRFRRPAEGGEPRWEHEPPFGPNDPPYPFIEANLVAMADAYFYRNSPIGRLSEKMRAEQNLDFESHAARLVRKEQKRAETERRRQEELKRGAEERRRRAEELAARRAVAESKKAEQARLAPPAPAPRPRAPLPAVPMVVRLAPLQFQDTVMPLTDLKGFALHERAALWWVSNQSDDLLCLPHCRIERLEYQVRTALRVLGPLRGRALLSDEVGLGKTIEAGLVAKELVTRGMVKRFLVLTLPSLVDQWAEELDEKFGLATVTSNQPLARDDPARFWRESPGIVASLHTLKQPAQLEIAREVHWDLLVVDEAHYLRNRASQAWQAVNALPRQFLLLLTATPVQNSLEELYNLVTLLQPGQLPSPKEFRARFLDPERPRQPREPEELRRLLGQVMIRNTRATAGIALPPRRAETVVLAPEPGEAEFWRRWEVEFRARLDALGAGRASLWGRLLLQAAGSSPAAWRAALKKFPDAEVARAWGDQAPLDAGWQRKCALLVPLTRGEHGAVVFTQFLDTQAALAEHLREAGVPAFVINGGTPAPDRQPITEEFRRRGGALLLTHSGTEGRNLQFCHTLANFDLPWNPMEIEQRIGRLHRLGQRHPVHIYNFVQAGTLQEHLLQVLQEKLNLFELVVGETGLVLGERFSGEEFEEEVFRRWQGGEGKVAEAIAGLGVELAEARGRYGEVKQLDETLFAQDFESQ